MIVDYFSETLGATIRSCIDCGVLIYGGPTRCVGCAGRPEMTANDRAEDFIAEATTAMRAELAAVKAKARRFKGWRVVTAYSRRFYGFAVEDGRCRITTKADALDVLRVARNAEDVEKATLVRVYRKPRAAK